MEDPGPLDCEILSLAANQTESVSATWDASEHTSASFAVTDIRVGHYGSAAAADQARRAASPDGQKLLSTSPPPALSLFQYRPGLGAVVDLRNLTVGGS